MEEWKVKNLYTLSESIASALLERVEYPWEALSGIKDFILEIGKSLPEDRFEKGERMSGLRSPQIFSRALILGGQPLLTRMHRYDTARLSEEAQLWEKGQ